MPAKPGCNVQYGDDQEGLKQRATDSTTVNPASAYYACAYINLPLEPYQVFVVWTGESMLFWLPLSPVQLPGFHDLLPSSTGSHPGGW